MREAFYNALSFLSGGVLFVCGWVNVYPPQPAQITVQHVSGFLLSMEECRRINRGKERLGKVMKKWTKT